MKKLVILLVMVPVFLHAQESAVNFENGLSWEQVQAKAKAENKYIFLDCYATWCGPCKEMDRLVYSEAKVGAYLNQNYISVKVQMDSTGKDNEQVRSWYNAVKILQKQYQVTAYPSFLFYSPEGKALDRAVGFHDADALITLAKNAHSKDDQYFTLVEEFERGTLDTSFMKSLARRAKDVGNIELAHRIANGYINHFSDSDMYKPDHFWFIREFTETSKDRGFAFTMNHSAQIQLVVKNITEDQVLWTAKSIIKKEEMEPFKTSLNGQPDWKRIKDNLKKYGALGDSVYATYKPGFVFDTSLLPMLKEGKRWYDVLPVIESWHLEKVQEWLVGSSWVYYTNSVIQKKQNSAKDMTAAGNYYVDHYISYFKDSGDALNDRAMVAFNLFSDQSDLEQALNWSQISIKLSEDTKGPYTFMYLDTYASLLFKLGRVKKALEWEQKAVALAPNDAGILANFEKMKKGEPTWTSN